MRSFSIAFLIGATSLLSIQQLPNLYWTLGIVVLFVLLLLVTPQRFRNLIYLSLAISIGFSWIGLHADWRLLYVLPKTLENKDVIVQGTIASIPEEVENGQRFEFQISKLQYQNHDWLSPGKVRLIWEASPLTLSVGDQWQLRVRLKRPHATLNPGSFDYEAWLFANNIRATGYVRAAISVNKLLTSHKFSHPLDRMRQYVAEFIVKKLQNNSVTGFITALTVGVRDQITAEQWQTLRNTGTNHLMAIAGLHIGLISGLVFFLVNFLWRRILYVIAREQSDRSNPGTNMTGLLRPTGLAMTKINFFAGMTKVPAQQAAAFAALIAAVFYSALAGFSLPTQRAVIMLGVFLITILLRRHLPPWHALLLALLIILFWDPLSILSSSFWLSFGVVALIIYAMSGRLRQSNKWWRWGRVQGIIAIGIIPLTLLFFQQISLAGFIANMLAIPWIGFIILPLCLSSVLVLLISPHLAAWIFQLAAKLLNYFWPILQKIALIPWLQWHAAIPNVWILIISCLGILLLLAPRGFPARWLSIIWLTPLFFWVPPAPKPNEVWFTLLDVGQGLASIVRTQHHVLIYDTGPKFNDNFNMGDDVVVPYLRTQGINHVDMLVISHGDNDHIGGAQSVIAETHVQQIITSVPQYFPLGTAKYCVQGQSWQWDGVNFEFLYPPPGETNLDNDSSCVLKITGGNKSLLLTGDIEHRSEEYLVNTEEPLLRANILVAPHHGSGTSSTLKFVQAVDPQYVLFPVGYLNRYKFPNADVVQRYAQLGAQSYDSATAGAIFFKFDEDKIQLSESYRKTHGKFWNND